VVGGVVESDLARWNSTRLGRRAPTDLTVLGGEVHTISLCAQTRAFRLGGSVVLACSSCAAGFDPAGVCGDPVLPPRVLNNFCKALEMAGPCEEPLRRDRPPITD
jgi:hypothetical protein